MRLATVVRIAPIAGAPPAPRMRDMAVWVRCPAIAGDGELGPLPFLPLLGFSDFDEELEPEVIAGLAIAYNGVTVAIDKLEDDPAGWVVLFTPVIPTTWVIPFGDDPPIDPP